MYRDILWGFHQRSCMCPVRFMMCGTVTQVNEYLSTDTSGLRYPVFLSSSRNINSSRLNPLALFNLKYMHKQASTSSIVAPLVSIARICCSVPASRCIHFRRPRHHHHHICILKYSTLLLQTS